MWVLVIVLVLSGAVMACSLLTCGFFVGKWWANRQLRMKHSSLEHTFIVDKSDVSFWHLEEGCVQLRSSTRSKQIKPCSTCAHGNVLRLR